MALAILLQACIYLWLTLVHLINDWHKNVHPGLQSSVVATHSLHQPSFPLLSKESLVVIKTKVFLVSLKFLWAATPSFWLLWFLLWLFWDTRKSPSRCSLICPRPVGQTWQQCWAESLAWKEQFEEESWHKLPNCWLPPLQWSLAWNCQRRRKLLFPWDFHKQIRLGGQVPMMLCSPRTETAWASLPTVPSSWAPSPT